MKPQKTKRFHWLAERINKAKYSTGAEVGCATGNTTVHIFTNCPSLRSLYVADNWSPMPNWKERNLPSGISHKRIFKDRITPFANNITILEGLSWEMAKNVPDNSLDFVFIDACHEYECVYQDILAWAPKLKAGGLLCGHDINIPGVLQAVEELIEGWLNTNTDNVWYCRKEALKSKIQGV